jgi:hypothetical protein
VVVVRSGAIAAATASRSGGSHPANHGGLKGCPRVEHPTVGGADNVEIQGSGLLELFRLRVAFHNLCRSCMAGEVITGNRRRDGRGGRMQRPYELPDLTAADRRYSQGAGLRDSREAGLAS